jgi:hypothetical protein
VVDVGKEESLDWLGLLIVKVGQSSFACFMLSSFCWSKFHRLDSSHFFSVQLFHHHELDSSIWLSYFQLVFNSIASPCYCHPHQPFPPSPTPPRSFLSFLLHLLLSKTRQLCNSIVNFFTIIKV